ncbi:MAG: ubiquinone/menaquinone biosynthesis methyltransferase [Candidatus Sericytochromatia bacterium]|nr:ubiquinone/menaquinone biosynthesis methyltransferase [Candidatus Tanganyikabacteria bacterium]
MSATVDREEVRRLFDAIATRYDRLNDLMTMGRHRAWKREVVSRSGAVPGSRVLDLCTGTGDLALGLAAAVGPDGKVTAVDGSEEMLALARRRPGAARVSWLRADALALPFAPAAFDGVTVGFGLRNLWALDAGLAEIRRVLRPGGRAVSLDLSKPRAGLLARLARAYEAHVVPGMAILAGAPAAPYRYLAASNEAFPDRPGLMAHFERAGFAQVGGLDLGLGAVAIVWGTAG